MGLRRVDGREKVTGTALYAGDVRVPGMAHAALVQAPLGPARVLAIHTEAARQTAGVLAVYTDAQFAPGLPTIQPPPEQFTADFPAERRAPLADNVIHYAGQHVALVVAETQEQALEAAALVCVEYGPVEHGSVASAELALRAGIPGTYRAEHFATNTEEPLNTTRGLRPQRAFVRAAAAFHTPVVHHNPMEPSAVVALWEGGRLTLHDSTRWVQGSRRVLAHMLSVPDEDVRVLAPFLGGAFGSKGFIWQHEALAAQAARALARPVKLVLTRQQMFTSTGHRSETLQQVSLQAGEDGALTGVEHHTLSETSPVAHFVEPCGLTSASLYRTPYAAITHQVAPLHRAGPCFMRAPGEASGMFALETSMDELASRLALDPLELRRRNEAERDLQQDRQWSSRNLPACCARGAELFGWGDRDPRPGSMRRGGQSLGWGMASAAYPARRSEAGARGSLLPDGTAVFSTSTQAIGTGIATILRQVAADALSWPPDRVRIEIGDSALPEAPVTGASQTTATVAPAVQAAALALRQALHAEAVRVLGPVHTRREGVFTADGRELSAVDLLAGRTLTREAHVEFPPDKKKQRTWHSFGAHFCEVAWDPAALELKVLRWVTVVDAGRILNPVTARSQISGGVLFALGQALMEAAHYDPRTGGPVNPNLAEYHLMTCADTPEFTIEFLEHPDHAFNPLGARGLGELGVTGANAALANAIHHATGARFHSLPITPDRILLGV